MSADISDYSEEYARCYDFITQHKDYESEVQSLLQLLESLGCNNKILSVGCGTGTHELKIAQSGYTVFGIDKSIPMIRRASSKSFGHSAVRFGTTFIEAEKHLGGHFGCVISLFNVINCCLGLEELSVFFQEIHSRMTLGGTFFFEAWNGIECLINPPQYVKRVFGDSPYNSITRQAFPLLRPSEQLLEIKYHINGFIDNRPVKCLSTHRLRLFSVNEILFLLSSTGFRSTQVFSSLPTLDPFDHNAREQARMLAFSAVA